MRSLIWVIASLAAALSASKADETAFVSDAAKVSFQWGVKIPMRDGLHLSATVYTPTDQKHPAPCVFTLTPYISQTYHDRGVYFAAHGYPFLTVDVRGRGNSEGEFRPLIQEAQDGYDIVEWLAAQPYCNGKVSMWGGSYAGYDQWATAKEFPPHLATIVPVASPYIGVDFPARNNIFTPYDMQWLTYTSGRAAQDRIFGDDSFWGARYRQWFEAGSAFSEFDTLLGNPSSIFKEWLAHPHLDAYWDRYNPTSRQYAKLQIPILTITGSHDDNQLGALTHYREHLKNASAEARARHYLVIGPWDHAGTRTPKAEFGGLTLGPASLVDLPKLHLDWYGWTMQGGARPQFLKKNVAYYVMGAEKWRYADTLEAVTAQRRPYYLASTANAADVFASGSLTSAQVQSNPDRYVYDPRDRSTGELESTPAPALTDQRLIYAQRGKQLVYHTAPFVQNTEVSGFFKLSAWIAIDQPDTDFAVTIHEIRADGSSILLTSDRLRARYRESFRQPKLIRTRLPLRYDFDRFTFVSREIRRGSRIRLVIAPLNSIYWQKNYNSGGAVADETIQDARSVTVTLYHDRAHPSALYVPVRQPDASPGAFVSWAREQRIALDSSPSGVSADSIKSVVGTAQVVALGEPAHGAHEPLAFRNRFFRYLVEQLGFTAIALESGLSESRRVHDFALGGSGDVQQITRDGLTWGFGDYAENIDLLRWIRQYNADPAHRGKVKVYGIDLSGGSDGQLATARIALDDALAYLTRLAPDSARRARRAVEPFLERFTHDRYLELSLAERERLRTSIHDVVSIFERERRALIAASAEEDYEWAYRNAIVARQLDELFRLWPAETPGEDLSPGFYRAAAARDAAMAENVRWVLKREGPSGRVLVFAHNAHVMNAPLRGGIWNIYPQPPTTMGQQLRAALGRNVLIIGTSSAMNGAGLPIATQSAGSVDTALGSVGPAHFLLDIREADQTAAVVTWLEQLQSMRANFTTQIVLPLRDAFDALVFIDRLTAADSLSDESKTDAGH